MDLSERVFELGQQGYCCSQIVMAIGLEFLEKENPDLIQSVAGLCYGMTSQEVCGVLSAGACLFALFHPEKAPSLSKELQTWFQSQFGCQLCADLIGFGQQNLSKCIRISTETIEFCFAVMEEQGLL